MHINAIAAGDLTPSQIGAWHEVLAADPQLASPHLRPEWVRCVAEARPGVEVGLLREGNEYVGFFPFQRQRLGIGEAPAGCQCDVQGIALRAGIEYPVELLLRRCGLQVWRFDHLLAAQPMFAAYHRRVEASPCIDLSPGFDSWRQQRAAATSDIAQARRNARRLAIEVGPLRLEWHTASSDMLATLVAWKRADLRKRGLVDPFQRKWFHRLVEHVANCRQQAMRGVLSVLYASQTPVAIHLGMHSGKVLSSWILAHCARHNRFSPEVLLTMELARAAAGRGIERMDLGRGGSRIKAALANGAVDVAIGSVDLRPTGRIAAAARKRLDGCTHALQASAENFARRGMLLPARLLARS